MSTTGKLTPQGRPSLRREAPPDHPIYKRGFVVGGHYSRRSSTTTPVTTTSSEKVKPRDKTK